jgi:hypothetical protein
MRHDVPTDHSHAMFGHTTHHHWSTGWHHGQLFLHSAVNSAHPYQQLELVLLYLPRAAAVTMRSCYSLRIRCETNSHNACYHQHWSGWGRSRKEQHGMVMSLPGYCGAAAGPLAPQCQLMMARRNPNAA